MVPRATVDGTREDSAVLPGEETVAGEQARVLNARPQNVEENSRARNYARFTFGSPFQLPLIVPGSAVGPRTPDLRLGSMHHDLGPLTLRRTQHDNVRDAQRDSPLRSHPREVQRGEERMQPSPASWSIAYPLEKLHRLLRIEQTAPVNGTDRMRSEVPSLGHRIRQQNPTRDRIPHHQMQNPPMPLHG
jgi:hypothetical protein